MQIKSKKESSNLIKNLNLNRVPELVLNTYNENEITKFCEANKSNLYILRDLVNPNGSYYFCKTKEEVLKNAINYKGAFSLAISCFAYDNRILVGDILITKENITITARNDKDANHRNIYENPLINLTTTLEDDRLWSIKGCKEIITYVIDHNLYNIIVEFVVYNKNVGTNNEKVLIVELRTNY